MNDENKGLKALVRSMKKALKEDHGIHVPYAALRAVYLQAKGEHPHAFASKKSKKTRSAGDSLMPAVQTKLSSETEHTPTTNSTHALYLAQNEIGCLVRLSLDEDGLILLPRRWNFAKLTLLSQFAQVPRVSKYGLPDYVSSPAGFYRDYAPGLQISSECKTHLKDLGDDSADSCRLVVCADTIEWERLLEAVLLENPSFAADVADWSQAHYKCRFEEQTSTEKVKWIERFMDCAYASSQNLDVIFEYVYPDEDGGHVAATLNLETGFVTLHEEVPDDIVWADVRTRIWLGEEVGDGEDHEVYFRDDKKGHWALTLEGLKLIQMSENYTPKSA